MKRMTMLLALAGCGGGGESEDWAEGTSEAVEEALDNVANLVLLTVLIDNQDAATYGVNLGWYDGNGLWIEAPLLVVAPGTHSTAFLPIPDRTYWLVLRWGGVWLDTSMPFTESVSMPIIGGLFGW